VGRGRRLQVALQDAVRDVHFGEKGAETRQFFRHPDPVVGPQALLARIPLLRRVQAEPDFPDFRSCRPESGKLLKIASTLNLLPRNRAMNGDAMADDVFEDAVVRFR